MSLANEYIASAKGWEQFDTQERSSDEEMQKYLDFAHKVATTFNSSEGKEVLKALVSKYLLADIVSAGDTQFAAGIKQGRASVVKMILAQIELSNNSK